MSVNTPTQTTEYSVKEIGCTTSDTTSKPIQTDVPCERSETVDMDKLAKWLNSIYPKMKEQLDRANTSKAFRNYRLLDDPIEATCKLVQTIQVTVREEGSKAVSFTPENLKPKLQSTNQIPSVVSNLLWNNSRSALAITCGYKHKTWCHHSGVVCVYQLNREEKLFPRKRLTCESCVTTAKFHPLHSNVLAAGTFTGCTQITALQNYLKTLRSRVYLEH